MRKLRAVLVDIYPPRLQRAGLHAAIDDLTAPLTAQGTNVEVDVPTAKLSASVEALIFRTIQEGLRNATKHARAQHVGVAVRVGRDRAEAIVTDDGVGFDPASAGGDGHMGLQMLGDLAQDAGGSLEVESAPGQGARVKLEVPLA